MGQTARAVTPTSSEAETDQESEVEAQCIDDSWPSETDSSAAQSPLPRSQNSPLLDPASVSSDHCGSTGEETKDSTYVALDVKEEGQSLPCPLEQENSKSKQAERDIDLEKACHEWDPKGVGDAEDEGKCRVCHLVFDSETAASEAIELGCDCKEDLSLAHRHCAEAWFKIKGNRTCEICGATAQNITGIEDAGFIDQWNDRDAGSSSGGESTSCWQNQSVCNFLLACMVVAFILPWLFRGTIF